MLEGLGLGIQDEAASCDRRVHPWTRRTTYTSRRSLRARRGRLTTGPVIREGVSCLKSLHKEQFIEHYRNLAKCGLSQEPVTRKVCVVTWLIALSITLSATKLKIPVTGPPAKPATTGKLVGTKGATTITKS